MTPRLVEPQAGQGPGGALSSNSLPHGLHVIAIAYYPVKPGRRMLNRNRRPIGCYPAFRSFVTRPVGTKWK